MLTGRQLAPLAGVLLLAVVAGQSTKSQTPGEPITLEQVVALTLQRYPGIRISEAGSRRAAAAIQFARTAYLPRLDAIAGLNRATRNNVLGLLLPSQVIAPISGPVLGTNSGSSAWGSTVGVLVTWEPFDFGQRKANVAAAEAGKTRADVNVERSRLELAVAAADSVMTLMAAQQTVVAAEAAVTRAKELQKITDALVLAELRPGAESSLARAERAAAQAQLIRAQTAVADANASLAGLLGIEAAQINIVTGRLLNLAPQPASVVSIPANPIAREAEAAIGESRAQLHALDRSYFPRFSVQGTGYARGTGALPNGQLLGGGNGLAPNIQNWGIGFTADFSVFEISAIRAKRNAENARLDAEEAKYRQTLIDLKARRARAIAAYDGAVQVSQTTPVAVDAARTAVAQARARYQAGLNGALEVADAQRRLAQAEMDDGLARLDTWRAILAVFAADGDISPVLAEASR